MPTPTAVHEFLEILQRSQLLKDVLFQKVNAQVPTLCDGELRPGRLARSLVRSQLITLYQAQKLMAGASEGFYFGKYKLLDLLGRGGMGKVYLAEQLTMNRVVALKVIGRFAKNRDDTLTRFAREAKAVAALCHPNIIQAFDYDELDGAPFMSLEYVEGIEVGDQVEKFGPIGWAQAADYAMQAARGLEAAHKAGFVHRDVKPGNLLVDREGNIKLLDLGLAVGREERGSGSLTTVFDRIGTVDFMAPEQAVDSHNVDIRADLYALGGVLYFMVTGQLPCPGKSAVEKLLKHQQTPPRPIRELVPDVPDELAKLIHQMLEKKRTARPQSPAEVAAALKPFAQRLVPPYDVSAIKYTREALAPLLGRSPELDEINARGQLSGVNSTMRGSSRTTSQESSHCSGSQTRTSTASKLTSIVAKGDASTMTGRVRLKDNSGARAVPVKVPTVAESSSHAAIERQSSPAIAKKETSGEKTTITTLTSPRVKKSLPRTTIVKPEPRDEFSKVEDELAELPIAAPIRQVKKKKATTKPRGMGATTKLLIGSLFAGAVAVVGFLFWDVMPSFGM